MHYCNPLFPHLFLLLFPSLPLTVRPEEVVNAEEYEVRRKKEYAKLCMSIKKKFREILPEGSTEFEEFREFVSTYTTDEHMLAILNATTPDAVFIQLSVGKFITENDTRLLQTLLAEYGDETVSVDRQQLTWFDLRKGFVEFSLKIASRVAERSTAAQLNVSILSTPVKFGCYYKMLESEQNVSTMIKILRDTLSSCTVLSGTFVVRNVSGLTDIEQTQQQCLPPNTRA